MCSQEGREGVEGVVRRKRGGSWIEVKWAQLRMRVAAVL